MFSFQFFILLVRSFSSSFISVCVFVSDFFSFYSNFWTSFNFLFSYLCSMVFIKEDIKKIYVKLLFWSLCLVFQLNFFLQDILQIRFLASGGCILSWLFIFLFFFFLGFRHLELLHLKWFWCLVFVVWMSFSLVAVTRSRS